MSDLSAEVHGLQWDVERSIRYHMRREGYFGLLHRWTAFVGVLSSTAAIALVLNDWPRTSIILSAVVALFTALDLVLGFASMERKHFDLRRRFIEIQSKLCATHTDALLAEMKQARLAIEQEEPPIYMALNLACHNELMRSRGHKSTDEKYRDHFHSLRWWQAMTMNISRWQSLA